MKTNPNKSFFWSFVTAMAAIILFSLVTGCVTEKQRLKICNNCAVKTETKEVTKVIHDTVEKQLPGKPGPVVYLDNPCKWLCDSLGNLKKDFSKHASKNGVNLFIATQGNGLAIATETRDTTLKIPVTNTITTRSEQSAYVKQLPCLNERTSFDGFCRWFFYIVAPCILIYIVLRFWLRLPI